MTPVGRPVADPVRVRPVAALLSTLVWGPIGLASVASALMSPMLFDAPGSEHNPYVWGVLVSLVAMPLLCFASVVGGWLALVITSRWPADRANAGRRVRAILSLLPLASVAGFVVCIELLHLLCGGSLRCR